MAKKITLASLSKKLKKSSEVKEIIEKSNIVIPELKDQYIPVVGFNYFSEGRNKISFYCHACGHSWIEDSSRYYGSYINCPHCEQKINRRTLINPGGRVSIDEKYAYVREVNEEEGYAIIVMLDYIYTHDIHEFNEIINDGKFEFLKAPFIANTRIFNEFMFSTTFGIRTGAFFSSSYNIENHFESINSNSYYTSLKNIANLSYIENDNYKLFVKMINSITEKKPNDSFAFTVVDASRKIINSRRKTTTSKPKPAKPKKVDIYEEVKLKSVTVEDIKENLTNLLSLHYETINNEEKFINYCPCCKKVFHSSRSTSEHYDYLDITCPNCNKAYLNQRAGRSGTSAGYKNKYLLFDIMPETNELILRYFYYDVTLYYEGKVNFSIKEYKRVFLTKTSKKILEYTNEKWSKPKKQGYSITSATSEDRWGSGVACCLNSNEELIEIISKTDFKYSGLLEAWGLVESPIDLEKLESPGTISYNSYLSIFLECPYIEQVYKTGLINATKNIINRQSVPNPYGTNVYEILNIGKPVYKMARQLNAHLPDIKLLNDFWNSDNTFDLNLYNRILNTNLKHLSNKMIEIRTKYNIKYQNQLEYLKNCYDYQCIHQDAALTIWHDYLNMASNMKYRLDDASKKYPQSLKKEHDKALFSYKVVADRINQEKFEAQAEKNAVLEYEGETFIVKVPRDPNEVIQEGTTLRHCVASYVENIRNGNTIVCFIRKKDEPSTSFFTSEVVGNVINQVKGYTNTLPKDEELLLFIREWAEKKNLVVGRHF
jgi:Zn finger protein HypA/HybF involved in hydrogenase expression